MWVVSEGSVISFRSTDWCARTVRRPVKHKDEETDSEQLANYLIGLIHD